MESIETFMRQAADRDVRFFLDGAALKTRAPAEAITDDMAQFIRANKGDIVGWLKSHAPAAAARGARIEPRGPDAPEGQLSLTQERFWFMHQLSGDSPLYNMPVALRIRGPFDVDLAERALQRIVERHAPLHSVFRVGEDGNARQVARPDRRFVLERVDLGGLDAARQQEAIEAAMRDSAAGTFDFAKDLMIRGAYLRQSAEEGVLLLCVHHIAADGWSMRVIELEFVKLYHAFAKGADDPLPPLRITYADYVHWQRSRLQDGSTERDLGFWERQLSGLPEVHSLPLDRPRSAQRGHDGGQYGFQLDTCLYQDLRRMALASGTTLFMLLHAGLSLLISRYSNQSDIVVGTPVLNRLERDLELLVGCFVNSLVLRVDCRPEWTLPELLQHVKTVNLDAQEHQEATFEQIVDRINPVRSALHTPLFQIMFSMGMPQETAHRQAPQVEITQLQHAGTTAKFDLSVYAQELAGELLFGLEYNRDLFDAETVEKFARRYQGLLRAMVDAPQARLADLQIWDASDDVALLRRWERGESVSLGDETLVDLFERQVALRPDADAIVYDGRRLCYSELDAQSNRLAHHLRKSGVVPGAVVGIEMGRCLEWAPAILAVWKAGAAYVPLDPAYPAQRRADMVRDAGAGWIIGLAHSTDPAAWPGIETILLDGPTWRDAQSALPETPLDDADRPKPGQLAYLVFTSGSTGRPKGVMVEHGSLANLAAALRAHLAPAGIPADARWAWNASPSFDASLQAVSAWSHGAALHLLGDDVRRDPQACLAYLREHRVDVMDATPLQVEMLLDHAGDGDRLPAILIGGEEIGANLWQRLVRHYAGGAARAWNVYGPTEATVDATIAAVEGDCPVIGGPLRNVCCFVVDRHGKRQPPGVPGELLVAGAGLARGYVAAPEITAERFVDINLDGEELRAYRTGDLVRWNNEGSLEFLGRQDGQVKVRGHRIELEEVARQLRALPGVAAATVRAVGDGAHRQLVGYFVPASAAAPPNEGEMIARLAASLPDAMVPRQLLALDRMPTTVSGKLDASRLPPPADPHASFAFTPPGSPAERLVAEQWSGQLRCGSVGVHQNFFELGGNSILAARVVSRISAMFRVQVPLRLFFEHPTVDGVVRILSRLLDAKTVNDIADVYLSVNAMDESEISARLSSQQPEIP